MNRIIDKVRSKICCNYWQRNKKDDLEAGQIQTVNRLSY